MIHIGLDLLDDSNNQYSFWMDVWEYTRDKIAAKCIIDNSTTSFNIIFWMA